MNKFQRYYESDRAAKAIYGIILIFTYLIAQQATGHGDAWSYALGALFAAAAIVLAEIYSEILGKTIRQKSKLSREQRGEVERDSLAIIGVSIWPVIFFCFSSLGLFGLQTAFNLSYIYCLLGMMFFSYFAFRASGHSQAGAIWRGAIVLGLGLVVVMAKYTLGH